MDTKVNVCSFCKRNFSSNRSHCNFWSINAQKHIKPTLQSAINLGDVECFQMEHRFKILRDFVKLTRKKSHAWPKPAYFRFFLYLFLMCFTFQVTLALPSLCSDSAPIDLLARSLSNEGGLPAGVEIVKDSNDVKGYRFDSSARLLGVEADEIFPLCNRFPSEFSILLTFQQQPHVRHSQYVMTLLAQDRNTVLLALRLQRNRLFFDYVSTSTGEKKSASMKSSRLNDEHWHTVVVTVTPRHVTFTLDCGTSKEKKLGSDFPKKINTRRTKIYVASRRKKRKRFTGLLRQLILLPGADAARQVCPSTDPSLASLEDNAASSSLPPEPRLIFEEDFTDESCSSQSRGTLMYTNQMTLSVCNGDRFKSVRGGPERMDYVIDYEDIITDNYTVSIETFTIPGEGLFLATANNDDLKMNKSLIFKWDGGSFVKFQEIKTQSAILWKFFEIDFEFFLMVANTGGVGLGDVNSVIYRWSSRRKRFEPYQMLQTFKVRSIEVFKASGNNFLFVANHRKPGQSSSEVGPSVLYIWDSENREFRDYQWFSTNDPLDVTFFEIVLSPALTYSCLVVANAFDGETSRVESEIYCWDGIYFVARQAIETVGAADWEFFSFEDRYFLVVANSFEKVPNSKPVRVLNSSVYELNVQYQGFVLYQEIETYGANDWEFFTIGNQYYLIVSNTVSSSSDIYRWQGIEKFVKVHSLPVGPCSDFDYIRIDGEHYLAFANYDGILSKLYKIVTY